MNNTTVKVTLDKRRLKRDNTYSIIFRVTHYGKPTSIQSGYSVEEKHWDPIKCKVKNSCKLHANIPSLNSYLNLQKSKYEQVIIELFQQDLLSDLSISMLKKRLVGTVKPKSFLEYLEEEIISLNKKARYGTSESRQDTLSLLKRFLNGHDLLIKEVTYEFLKDLEEYYIEGGKRSYNGLAVHLRNIKARCNAAIKEGFMKIENYPFQHYKIKTVKPKKKHVDMEVIKKIILFDSKEGDTLFHARNYFLMSFFMMGRPFVDLAFLKKEYIGKKRIEYKRVKTHTEINIEITDQLKPFIDYYTNHTKGEFLLPIITSKIEHKQYKQYSNGLDKFNTHLKKLSKRLGLEKKLSSYVARHSFASIALKNMVPVEAIREMLGHQRISTTEAYLGGFGTNAIDEFNRQIISSK